MASDASERAGELSAYPHQHRFTVPVEWEFSQFDGAGNDNTKLGLPWPAIGRITILRCESCNAEVKRG